MTSGDSVCMEFIESEFCGVFMLLDKNKYIEIILSQMEKKYNEISYSQLHKIRINSGCRYKANIDDKNIHFPMHVLDEVMENVNMWVKKLPVNHDPKSWVTHSPNVCLAQRCVAFEKAEYKRGFINLEKMLKYGIITDRNDCDTKYVEPKKTIEKQHVFEFVSRVLKTESVNTRLLDEESFIAELNNLETKLKKKVPTEESTISPFEDQDLNEIFEVMNGTSVIPDDDSSSNDSGISIVTNDTDMSTNTLSADKENDPSNEDDDDLAFSISNVTLGKANRYSTSDILSLAKEEMKQHSFNEIRMRKKQRRERNDEFLYSLFQKLDGPNNNITQFDCWLKNSEDIQTTNRNTYDFTRKYREIKEAN